MINKIKPHNLYKPIIKSCNKKCNFSLISNQRNNNYIPTIIPMNRKATSSHLSKKNDDIDTESLLPNQNKEKTKIQSQKNDEMRQIDYYQTFLLFFFPAIGGFLFGYDIGGTSGALASIKSEIYSGIPWYNITSLQEGALVSSSLLGGMLGSCLGILFGEKIGRKKEIITSSIIYFLGTMLRWHSVNFKMLFAGSLVYGTGIGLAMHSTPTYIAETAPSKFRGFLISLKEALIVFGILTGYIVSYVFLEKEEGWRYIYGFASPFIILFFIGMIYLPESYRYIIMKKDFDRAKKALERTFGNIKNKEFYVNEEMKDAIETLSNENSLLLNTSKSPFNMILGKQNIRPLYIGVSLMFFQQVTGQPTVLYYASSIFQQAGFNEAAAAASETIYLGIWKLLMTIAGAATVDYLGRRILLLTGVSALTLSLFALGICQKLIDNGMTGIPVYLNLIALLVFVGSYQFSFGPISWLIVGEIFPLNIRNQGVAISTFTNFGMNYIMSLIFPILVDSIGLSNQYLLYGVVGVLSVGSIYLVVPETKGKTLEEIESEFKISQDAL